MIDRLRAIEMAKFIIKQEMAFPGTYHHEVINEAVRKLEELKVIKHKR